MTILDYDTIFVPDKEGIRMDGRVVKSDLHSVFDQYWFCKKMRYQKGSNLRPDGSRGTGRSHCSLNSRTLYH